MSECSSFSYYYSCYICVLVVALLPLCSSNQNFDDALCISGERHALLQFKHSLVDEGDRLASWVGESDCCKWVGITCDNVTGHVHHVHLPGLDGHCNDDTYTETDLYEAPKNRLKGSLSPSLLHLKQLRHLDLSCNDFKWTKVPKFIGSFGNLRYLNLSSSKFVGIIPPELGNLTKLQVLCLGSFQEPYASTSMMNMQWLSSLGRLHHLDLSGVDLSKASDWLQVMNSFPSLVKLLLSNCQLSQIDSHVFGPNITSLSLLDFSNNNFDSSLPRWIFTLTNLISLDLSGCNFHGAVPYSTDSFRNLTSLELLHVPENDFMNSSLVLKSLSSIGSNLISLNISSCGVSSSVFDSLHNMTSLLSLDLSSNQLTKTMPKSLGNFCNLKEIDLSYVSYHNIKLEYLLECFFECKTPALESLSIFNSGLSGHLPSQLGQLIHLEHLQLGYNSISGSIPNSIGELFFLRKLDLRRNLLSGPISYSIGHSSLLVVLRLDNNQISGPIPFSIRNLSSLEVLRLDKNLLSGPIPFSIGQLSSLEVLRLNKNLICGPIPFSIGHLSSLEVLYLHSNKLNGSLPFSIGRLSSLKDLHLSYNQLDGNLPNSIGQLSKLEELSFSSNLLTGIVTETHFVKLVSLKYLNGSQNSLTLRLQNENWIPPFQLTQLSLNSWGLGPQIPSWLQSQKQLVFLEISNTGISSHMPPESFWISLPSLRYLHMSHNHIKGTLLSIPASVNFSLDLSSNEFSGELPDLSNGSLPLVFDLSNNFFTGSLHHFLCSDGAKGTNVALNFENNVFSGVIPDCWEKWLGLEFLNLKNNNLSGGIPRSLGNLSYLRSLILHGNKLSGRLPASLMNLTNLNIIQLGGNELVGSIPTWLGTNFPFLRLLNIRSNYFDGIISHQLCYLTRLQILDLADNNLSGNIPRCFKNFSILSGKETTLDEPFRYYVPLASQHIISSDSLVMKGREDTYTTILPLVLLLDLSDNNLSGNIPVELSGLTALQSLNLSRNQLTGGIPVNIGDMKSLETFDLSVNKLSGKLPVSLSTLHFLSNFNVSCNSLTGRIPSSTQLQSLNESCFVGNKLCGDPLTVSCTSVETDTKDHEEDDGSDGADWALFISTALGFVVGFWVIVAPLLLIRSWRIAYFRFMSELKYMIYDVAHKYCFSMFSK